MLISNYITPVMYSDISGKFPILTTIILVGGTALLTFTFMACTKPELNPEENITATGSASADPTGYGYEFMGVGFYGAVSVPTQTVDFDGVITDSHIISLTIGPYNASFSQSSDGSNTLTIGKSIFFASVNLNEFDNINSYGAGLSFGASTGTGPNASGSIDVNYLQIIIDVINSSGGN